MNAAQEIRENYHNAFVISNIFNFVPDLPDPSDQGSEFKDSSKLLQTMGVTTQDSISSIWNDVLKYSRVLDLQLSDAEKEKIEKLREQTCSN